MSSDIPDGWSRATLAEVAGECFTDGDWVESKDQDPTGGVRLIQLADIGDGRFLDKSNRFLSDEKARELRCTMLRPGDLLIARMADPIARCCIFPEIRQPAATVVDVTIVRPGPDVDCEFLSYAVSDRAFRTKAIGAASGTTRSRISRSNLGLLDLPIPPIEEQKRIAEVLRSVDRVIALNEEEIEHAKKALRAYSLSAFGPAVPANHEGVPIDELLERIIDYRGVPPPKSPDGVPLITAKNVRFGYLDPEPREFIAHADYDTWMRRGIPKAGDVMFTTEAPLANVAEFPGYKAALGQRTITLVPNSQRLDSAYLKWLLLSPPAQALVHKHATGSTAKGIKQTTFRKLKFNVPAVNEQKRIGATCGAIWEAVTCARASIDQLRRTKASLLRDLLSGCVRVPA